MARNYLFCLITLVLALGQLAAAQLTARQAFAEMGRGINLGNTYDLVAQDRDPATQRRMFDLWWDKGFRNVRIPVTWCNDVYSCNFDPGSLLTQQVNQTVSYAIEKGFYVILNAHHEHWLKDNYDGSSLFNDKFWGLWRGIAQHFAQFSDKLMYEVLNEPEGAFGDWHSGTRLPNDPVAIEFTRRINGVGYDAIRAVDNSRIIILAPNAQGNQGQINDIYPTANDLPGNNDPYLGVTLHTYDPWSFCGQTGSNNHFSSVDAMRSDLNWMFNNVESWFARTNVPTHFGEYGVGRQYSQSERDTEIVREYYRYVTNRCIANGWPTSVWDDRGWFRITDNFQFPMGLANAVLNL